MSEFSVRSDSVDVEQIMRQIRARIREKRGADYTEAELEKLASVKLEKFLDPRGLRSDLVQQFRARVANQQANEFNEAMLYDTHRPLLKKIRKWLNPVLKLMINPAAISGAMKREQDVLFYEVVHNLVVEITRLGIEVHNMKMRVESMSSRLDFDESGEPEEPRRSAELWQHAGGGRAEG
jgi:glutaredoxin 2